MPEEHARLNCSGAYRWMACPGSPALEAKFPRSESAYAAEGTAAHELHEIALLLNAPAADCLPFVPEIDADAGADAAEHVQVSLDWINDELAKRPGAYLLVERRLRPGKAISRDDLWGTADALIVDAANSELLVIDLKFGMGVVEVAGNKQLQLYGLGALSVVDWSPERITLVITQPRARHRDGPVRTWTVTAADLESFAATVTEAAKRTEDPAAPLVPGDHCGFCRAAGGCTALAEHALQQAQIEFGDDKTPLAPSRIAELLHESDLVKGWAKALEAHALAMAENGERLPGWRLVRRRGKRTWNDQQEAIVKLTETYGVTEDVITEPRALKSPRQVEMAIKRETKKKADLGQLCSVPDIGWRLAPDSAPGDDFMDAEDEFAGIDVELEEQ